MFAADSNRPVPAAIDGRPWVVGGAPALSGATNTRGAEMFVPLIDTPTARMIRNHEMVHARITPRVDPAAAVKKHGVTIDALQWAEDYRVTRRLCTLDLYPDDAITDAEADIIAGMCADARTAAGAMLANYDADHAVGRINEALIRAGWPEDTVESILARVTCCVRGARAGLPTTRRRRGRSGKLAPGPLASVRGFAQFTVPLARLFDAEFPPGGDPSGRGSGDVPHEKLDAIRGRGRWAPVTDIRTLPMDRAVRPRRPIGRRFSDCGAIPSAFHRHTIDGAIFGTKRRARGGTILCDASGSMHYRDEDIERILQEAPAAKIAFYAGAGAGGSSPRGEIVIAADRGRAATVKAVHDALPGCDNLIDGPALRWLAKQPGPRVWVTDGGVGGINDFGRDGPCYAECVAICRAAGIKIVLRISEVC